MRKERKQRLYFIALIITGVSVALGFMLYALSNNINFFISPTQIQQGQAPLHQEFRLGGLVAKNSVHYLKNGEVIFTVTDNQHQIEVHYQGILPDLFKAGRAVVTEGHLQNQQLFIADQVLAKHDNQYMPQQIKQELKKT
ncbi:MAG: cytochrome c maturation protein CcmE [Legionellales bacterium]|nr:cytochrome c maturation protein CcmE [Legionellales bacterium]